MLLHAHRMFIGKTLPMPLPLGLGNEALTILDALVSTKLLRASDM